MAIVSVDEFTKQSSLTLTDLYEPVKVRRWDDTSAPSLTGQNGSLITVLDAVLVNGYGDKTALGWTKVYSGTNKAAYRNDSNYFTGFYIRFGDDQATSSYAAVKGYEAMTGIDFGTNGFPSTTARYVAKSATTDSTARPWVVYGDSGGFWLLIYRAYTSTGGSNYAAVHFFGDFETKVSGDTYNCVIGGSSDGSSYPYTIDTKPVDGYSSNSLFVARMSDGTGADGDNYIKMIEGASCMVYGYPGERGLQAGSWNNQLLYSSFGGVDDGDDYTYRGFMPGIFYCLHDRDYMTDDVQHDHLRYHKIGFGTNSDSTGAALFNTVYGFREHV